MITNQNRAHAIAEFGFESALVQGKQHSKNAVRLRLRLPCRYSRSAEANRMQVEVDQGSTGTRIRRYRVRGQGPVALHCQACIPLHVPATMDSKSGCFVRRLACRHESRGSCSSRDRDRGESQNRRRLNLRSHCVEDFCAVCPVFGEQGNHMYTIVYEYITQSKGNR